MKFIQRILVINGTSSHKQDGVTILRVVISLFENLPGQMEDALPFLVEILLAEMIQNFENSAPNNYRSMLLQAMSMALFNSSVTTMRKIEEKQQTFMVFGKWLAFMGKFKLEFEIRRIVFGLLSILKMPANEIP